MSTSSARIAQSQEVRSKNMKAIRSRNTKPELSIRRALHAAGYRYRLHVASLPGKPDLVFPKFRKIIFVHGCFFHMHDCRYGRVVPQTNKEVWKAKRERNVDRDSKVMVELKELGWQTSVIWECTTRTMIGVAETIREFLEADNTQ